MSSAPNASGRASWLLEQDFALINDLLDARAEEHPNNPAIICGDKRVTYRQFQTDVASIAGALQSSGHAKGAVVALLAEPSIRYYEIMLAAARAGVIFAPIATWLSLNDIAAIVRDCAARTIFVDRRSTHLAVFDDVKSLVIDDEADWRGWTIAAPFSAPELDRNDAFSLSYSSGTTGTPKGVLDTHLTRWSYCQRPDVGETAIMLLSTPPYSVFTFGNFLAAIAAGGSVVQMEKFDANEALSLIERERVTHLPMVPVQYQRLLAAPMLAQFNLASLQSMTCAGAPLSAFVKREILQRLPGDFIEWYGMSEGAAGCGLYARHFPDKLHTVGQPMPGVDMRIIDQDDREVSVGEIGEIVGASPKMMPGYFKRPEETRRAEWFDAGGKRFLRTGDMGEFDADGFLILRGRKKEMIISGGQNIYPLDIESVLSRHAAVAECAVVGARSETWGETPVAFVVLNGHQDARELLTWTNARLGRVQRISRLEVVPALPRSGVGKVLKRELQARLRAA